MSKKRKRPRPTVAELPPPADPPPIRRGDDDYAARPPCVHLAFDGCLEHWGFDLGRLPTYAAQTPVISAAFNAEEDGPEAAKQAAADCLHSLATVGLWTEYLRGCH